MTKLVEPYAKITSISSREEGVRLLQVIEEVGRTSHLSEESQTPESYGRFIKSWVMEHGDWSLAEFADIIVEAIVDRGIQTEWVRHRLFSFCIESTRFVNYTKKKGLTFIVPGGHENNKIWELAIETCEESYRKLVEQKVPPQIARDVLPLSLASKCKIKGNLRNWRHFLLMRTTKETHPKMLQVTIPLLIQFQEYIPFLFDDIIPLSLQRENIKIGR